VRFGLRDEDPAAAAAVGLRFGLRDEDPAAAAA
jgi:hypothetical protein